jgi:hypothetical protein
MRTKGEPANDEEDQMTTEARLQPGQARSPRESVRDLLAREVRPVPAFLEEDRYEFLGSEDLPKERYYSREFHDLEVARMWRKVWQWACLEQDIPSVGDTLVYEIADASIIGRGVCRRSEGPAAAQRDLPGVRRAGRDDGSARAK